MKLFMTAITMIAILMFSVGAMAATDQTPLAVSANVVGHCRMISTTSVVFVDYDPTDTANNDTGVGDMTLRCTKGTNYKLYIEGTRTMTSGTENLNFLLFSDLGRTAAFPSDNSSTIGGTSTTASTDITQSIYGRIPAGQDVTAGLTFSQTLQATVEY